MSSFMLLGKNMLAKAGLTRSNTSSGSGNGKYSALHPKLGGTL